MQSARIINNSPVVLSQPQLIRVFGAAKALFLSQINYWIKKESSGVIYDGKRWIFNTAKELADQIGVSIRQVERIIANLREEGIIEVEKLAPYKSNRTNYYTINYDLLSEIIESKGSSSKNNTIIADKMTESPRQDVGMVSTKITNKKEITKSEEHYSKSIVSDQSKQVQQVDEIKNCATFDTKKQNHSTTVQDMISIWNNIFPKNQAKLTKELARNLNYAFQNKFDSNMNLWKTYCLTIETSVYLISDKFSLHLDWAIKFKTMDDIESGRYGCKNLIKELKVNQEIEDLRKQILSEIDQLSESKDCKNLRHKLLGQSVYNYSRLLRKVTLYKDGRSFFFITENEEDVKDIQRTYPIDLHGLGTFERYEQIKKIKEQSMNQKPQSDLDFELMLINSSSESEMIKEKRRELCAALGMETYIKHFRILNLIEINGDIWVGNRGGEPVLLSDKIKELICDSLTVNNPASHTEASEQSSFLDKIEKLDESELCQNTRKALLKTFGIETYL